MQRRCNGTGDLFERRSVDRRGGHCVNIAVVVNECRLMHRFRHMGRAAADVRFRVNRTAACYQHFCVDLPQSRGQRFQVRDSQRRGRTAVGANTSAERRADDGRRERFVNATLVFNERLVVHRIGRLVGTETDIGLAEYGASYFKWRVLLDVLR